MQASPDIIRISCLCYRNCRCVSEELMRAALWQIHLTTTTKSVKIQMAKLWQIGLWKAPNVLYILTVYIT